MTDADASVAPAAPDESRAASDSVGWASVGPIVPVDGAAGASEDDDEHDNSTDL